MTNKKVTIEDFRQICLTCLESEKELIPIFNCAAANMLNYCNLLLISKGDRKFPDKMCSACIEILRQSYEFKQMIESSYSTLKEVSKNEQFGRNIAIKLRCDTFEDFDNTEDTSGDSAYNTTDGLLIKCEEPLLNTVDKTVSDVENRTTEVLHQFSKNNSNSIKLIEKSQELEKNTNEDRRCLERENEDLISFLDAPLPSPLQFCCQKCDQSFSEENDLQIHQSVHNSELICVACSKKFINRQMLKRHLKIHLIRKPHVCKICSKSFAESYALTKHLRRHSGVPREKKHICSECGQGFSEPYYLKVHIRKHTGERPLLCSDCRKPFADPRSLKIHSMIHTGEKPHKCNICLKSFIQRANLTKHVRTHTGEKPYLCKLCDKRFSQSSTLGKHLRTHTGEKLYTCDKCGKGYADKSRLINHVKSHYMDQNPLHKEHLDKKETK